MNKIWICSDLHFCHDKDFIYQPRGFDCVYDMDEAIIRNFNKIMDDTDTLYILGDCFLNNDMVGMQNMERLPGKKHIVWGNHDTNSRKEKIEKAGYICHGYADVIKYNGYTFYLSHYPSLISNYDEDKPLKRQIINLCGHTHTQDKFKDMDKGNIYHVELDAHFNYPVSIDSIIEDIKGYYRRRNYEEKN